jgi:hypothetical protein
MSERAFSFLRINEREGQSRKHGITEIRGPYYTPMGEGCLRMCWRRWANGGQFEIGEGHSA